MTGNPPAVPTEPVSRLTAGDNVRPRRGDRGGLVALVLVLVGLAAAVVVVADPFSGAVRPSGVSDNRYPTSTQTVLRKSISQQTQVSATLGYAGEFTIRLPSGNAPAMVAAAQQAVTTDQMTLSGAQSMLQSDAAALSQARSVLAADRGRERVDCAGANAAQTPSSGGASATGGASGSCAGDVQLVLSARQPVATDAAKVSTDQAQVRSAEAALVAAQRARASADAEATVYGVHPTFTYVPSAGKVVRRGQRLCSVNGQSTLLLYGSTVVTRAFTAGMSPGVDVAELNANLDALGYAHGLTGDAFTSATVVAIDRLQAANGESQTGALLLGAVVFEPGAMASAGRESHGRGRLRRNGRAAVVGDVGQAAGFVAARRRTRRPGQGGRPGHDHAARQPDNAGPGQLRELGCVERPERVDDPGGRGPDEPGRDRRSRPSASHRVDHHRKRP